MIAGIVATLSLITFRQVGLGLVMLIFFSVVVPFMFPHVGLLPLITAFLGLAAAPIAVWFAANALSRVAELRSDSAQLVIRGGTLIGVCLAIENDGLVRVVEALSVDDLGIASTASVARVIVQIVISAVSTGSLAVIVLATLALLVELPTLWCINAFSLKTAAFELRSVRMMVIVTAIWLFSQLLGRAFFSW